MSNKRKNLFKKSIALSVCFAFLTLFIPIAGQTAAKSSQDSEKPFFSKTLYFWSVSMSDAAFINFFFDKPGKGEKKKDTKDKSYDKNDNRTSKKKGNGQD